MRDLARWPMENGSVIRILDDCASYVIIADEAVAPTSELPSHLRDVYKRQTLMISAATPNLIRSLSVTKKAFLKPRLAASTAITLRHPAPK